MLPALFPRSCGSRPAWKEKDGSKSLHIAVSPVNKLYTFLERRSLRITVIYVSGGGEEDQICKLINNEEYHFLDILPARNSFAGVLFVTNLNSYQTHHCMFFEAAIIFPLFFLDNRVRIPGLCIKVMHTATAIIKE
jgi:hypothetical protein